MDKIVPFTGVRGLQRVKSAYSVREISSQFGLGEHHIRRWAREGLITAAPPSDSGELRFDLRALRTFRRVRDLRGQGLSFRQIEAELRGQMNLFPEPEGRLLQLPVRLSPFEQALLYHDAEDSRAADAYQQAIGQGDSVADAFCNLGILEFEARNIPGAFGHFTNSLRHDPRHFESHYNLANLYLEEEDFRLARLHYELASEIEPNFPDLHFNLGLVHALMGNFPAAVLAFEKAKEFASDDDGEKIAGLLESLRNAIHKK
jgi:tetratricopeptide (TPR) repeat protein